MASVAPPLRSLIAAALALMTLSAVLAPSDASAAGATSQVGVTFSRVTPSVLTPGASADLTVQGEVRNTSKRSWSHAQAYLVIPANPIVSHTQARENVRDGLVASGRRLLNADLVDRLGDLKPGETSRFSLSIPYDRLGVSGAEGVYPLGVHVRARGAQSLGHALTFLPLRPTAGKPVPISVLWPFIRPSGRLTPLISPGGRLRNLLNLARSTPRRGSDVIIDPALVAKARAIGDGKPTDAIPEKARRAADDFADDLIGLAKSRECWATSYDRPDALALESASAELRDLVAGATTGTLKAHRLRCARLEWPSPHGVSRDMLSTLPHDAEAVIVAGSAVPAWQSTSGNVLDVRVADRTPVLLVDDSLDALTGLRPTPLTLRQRILSEATWSSMARANRGRDTTVIVIDPRWNPGKTGHSHLDIALRNKYVDAMGFDEQLERKLPAYTGALPPRAKIRPIKPSQVASATDAAHTQRLLSRVLVEPAANLTHEQEVATTVSQRWRIHRKRGESDAQAVNEQLHGELAAITVEGPAALTLSSSKGRFPITVSNNTSHRVSVGTVISSSNPAVKISIPKGSVIAAGENRTVTASIDMDGQSAVTVSIHLTTADGAILGAPTGFNVRSSRVGAALWVAIGISAALVALALLRRFARPGHRPEHPMLPPDDFND